MANQENPPAHLVMELEVPVPNGVGVEGVRKAFASLFRRHEILRTTFPVGSDGKPYQVIHPPSTPNIRIVDSCDQRTPASDIRIDLEHDFPVQVELLAPSGVPVSVSLFIHHIAADWTAIGILKSDVESSLKCVSEGREPHAIPAAWNSRRQAELEVSANGRRRSEAALDYWRSKHAVCLRDFAPTRQGKDDSTGHDMDATSREIAHLCQAVAQKSRCLPAAVMMSAIAVSVAHSKGRDYCLLSPLVSNRFNASTQNAIGTFMARGWALLDFRDDPPFSVVLRNSMKQLLNVARHGSFDDSKYYMELVRSGLNGAKDGALLFNFITDKTFELSDPNTRIKCTKHTSRTESKVEVAGNGEAFFIKIRSESSFLGTDESRKLIEGLPELLEQVDKNPETVISQLPGVLPRWMPPSEAVIDLQGAWADLRELAQILGSCPGVKVVKIFPETARPRESSNGLTMCAVVESGVTARKLRDFIADIPDGNYLTLSTRFILREDAPGDLHSMESWLKPPLLEQGNGRDGTPVGPQGMAESSLSTAFQKYHPRQPINMDLSYAENRGDYIKIPALMRHLRQLGLRGLTLDDFMSVRTLRRLARQIESGNS